MAIAVVGTVQGSNLNLSTYSINLPTGTTVGHITLISIAQVGNTTITPPAGWAKLQGPSSGGLFYRVFQSGDPTTVTFTSSAGGYTQGVAITYSGVDTTNPIDSSNGYYSAFTNFIRAPSVQTKYNGGQLVVAFSSYGVAAVTMPSAPAGMTTQVQKGSGPGTMICDQALTGTPLTGDKDTSITTTGSPGGSGISVVLKAAGATLGTPAAPVPTVAAYMMVAGVSGNTFTINLAQFGLQVGDLATVAVGFSTAGTLTAPSGWGLITQPSTGRTALYSKVMTSADIASTSVSFGNGGTSTFCGAAMLVVRGMGGRAPAIDNYGATFQATAGATCTTPTVAVQSAGELQWLAWLTAFISNGSWSGATPSLTNPQSNGTGVGVYTGWNDSCASPAASYSNTNSVANDVGYSVAYKLAAVPGSQQIQQMVLI